MATKMRIRVGELEFAYEGEEPFIDDRWMSFAKSLVELGPPSSSTTLKGDAAVSSDLEMLTTGTIAARIGVKTGADLALAAGATLTEKQGKFTRKEVHEEMKTATAFYKQSYGGNLSSYLSGLVKAKKFNEVARDTYSLTEDARKDVLGKIAG